MKLAFPLLLAFAALSAVLVPQAASAKCVARTVARVDGSTEIILAVAPDGGSMDLAAAGFADTECRGLDKTAYRAKVCAPRSLGNAGVQRQMEAQAGITFTQLCAAARAEAGLPSANSKQVPTQFSPSNSQPVTSRQTPGADNPLRKLLTGRAGAGGL